VLDPFVALEKRLSAGHYLLEMLADNSAQRHSGQVFPIMAPVGLDDISEDLAVLLAARLGPKAVKREMGGIETQGCFREPSTHGT
jgi:hypothetical protein